MSVAYTVIQHTTVIKHDSRQQLLSTDQHDGTALAFASLCEAVEAVARQQGVCAAVWSS
jgi:hypothetical protein